MKGENRKRIFSRENVLFSLIPEVGVFLVLLAEIILSALSVRNEVADACLLATFFIFLAWLIFGVCYLSLRSRSGKKKAVRIIFIAAMCILAICGGALMVWDNAVFNQIEQLQTMMGSAEWSAAMAEELARAESLYETLQSAVPIALMITLLVGCIGGAFLRDWRSEGTEHPPQAENPTQTDIDET